jgi:hypothetical protein
MPKKKKQFIDKKAGQTFSIGFTVHTAAILLIAVVDTFEDPPAVGVGDALGRRAEAVSR